MPMQRTTTLTPKGERTREHLLDTALRLFTSAGYEATTMRDIAAAAECSLGLAYRYFASKEEFVLALSFPHAAWYMRLGRSIINAGMWLQRSGYRFYVHEPAAIRRVAADAGLRPVDQIASWPWRIALFERIG